MLLAPHSWGFLFVGGWVDLRMIKYIPLLLLIGLTWTQKEDWDIDIIETSLLAYKVELFSDGYIIPWGMSFLPDGDLIVSDICGKIYRVNYNGNKKMLISNFPEVFYQGQGGLLDVEVNP